MKRKLTQRKPCVSLRRVLFCLFVMQTGLVFGALGAPSGVNMGAEVQQQQSVIVTGKITDPAGAAVPGVSVMLKGTMTGVVSDGSGAYSIKVTGDAPVLEFSMIGYVTQAVSVDNRKTINVVLAEDSQQIGEVVVVGFGTQKKVNMTGSVAAVKVDETMASRTMTNVSSGLSGLVPGLTVTQNTGMAGSDGAEMSIRGMGSPNSSSPLVVVDGMPDVDINKLNMSDIESISVLKDASSAAIYGSRAANGVILITTKRGESGKVSLNYNASFAWRNLTNYYESMADYPLMMQFHNMSNFNAGKSAIFTDGTIDQWMAMQQIDPIRFPNTNWWDVLFKTGQVQNHTVSASGGSDKMNFYVSAGYMKDTGMSINTDYKRKNFRVNLDYKIRKNIKIGTNVDGTWTDQSYGKADGVNDQGRSNVQWDIVKITPGVTVQAPDGRYGGHMAYKENSTAYNMYAQTMNAHNLNQQQQFVGNIYGEWKPISDLTLRFDYGLDFNNQFLKSWSVPFVRWNFQTDEPIDVITSNGGISNRYENAYKTLMQGRITYDKEIADGHRLTVMGVYTEEYWYGRWASAGRSDRIHPDLSEINAALLNKAPTAEGSSDGEGLRSVIGRVNYNIRDKYLFEANLRADASSKFLSGFQWGVFPSFSAGWRFSQEAFFERWGRVVTNGKLRASLGWLGNNSGVKRYEQRDTYLLTNYSFSQSLALGTSQNKMINPDFTWEKSRVTNIGLDLAFWGKLTAEFDAYDRLTNNIIRSSELSTILSGYEAPRTNIGELRNRGLEINLGWRDRAGDFEYGVHLNYAFNRNKLLSWNERLGPGVPFLGYPYSFVRGYVATGLAQTWDDIMNAPYQGSDKMAPGDILYQDMNGDGQITDDDMAVLRNTPRSFFNSNYGLTLDARWKNIDINMLFQASTGSKDYWQDYYNLMYPNESRYAYNDLHKNYWSLDNRQAAYTRLVIAKNSNGGRNDLNSSYWLYSRSYIRLKSLQIGYSLPKAWMDKVKIQNIRLYVTGENLFTITKWPGIDPEKTGGSGKNQNPYPLARSFAFGISVTL